MSNSDSRTPDEMAKARRALLDVAPTVHDRFALMFGWPPFDTLPIHQKNEIHQDRTPGDGNHPPGEALDPPA